MNKPIKKIIAREVLVLLGIIIIGVMVASMGFFIEKIAPSPMRLDTLEKIIVLKDNLMVFGFAIVYLGYPIYLLIRLIFWAIKTLRKK